MLRSKISYILYTADVMVTDSTDNRHCQIPRVLLIPQFRKINNLYQRKTFHSLKTTHLDYGHSSNALD